MELETKLNITAQQEPGLFIATVFGHSFRLFKDLELAVRYCAARTNRNDQMRLGNNTIIDAGTACKWRVEPATVYVSNMC